MHYVVLYCTSFSCWCQSQTQAGLSTEPYGMGRHMEWAGRMGYMWGIPRKMMFVAVGAFAKAVANLLNTTTVHNADTLIRLVQHRPPGVPLVTVSNHMSTFVSFPCFLAWFSLASKLLSFSQWCSSPPPTLTWLGFTLYIFVVFLSRCCFCGYNRIDDPVMWGFKGFPTSDATLGRWVLAAEDICFKNVVLSYLFRLGKRHVLYDIPWFFLTIMTSLDFSNMASLIN